MNGLEVVITDPQNDTRPMTLLTLVRRDEGSPFDYHSCHLFACRGTEGIHEALESAVKEYLAEVASTYEDSDGDEQDMDWFEMMAEREDYGEIFAKHGLTEVRIPMGMASIVVHQGDPIAEYLEG